IYTYPERYGGSGTLSATLTTDSDGCVTVTEKRFGISASYKDSKWSNRERYYNNEAPRDSKTTRMRAGILSDRSIYHPGDSLKAVAVAYSVTGQAMSLDSCSRVTLKLIDANRKTRAEESCMTDRFGRASCAFEIPADGLLGTWRVEAYDADDKRIGYCQVNVADYVAPTFFVTTDNDDSEPAEGDTVCIRGEVLTYSGMPVAGAKVEYNVRYSSPMRWWYRGYATYNGSVTADAAGKYEILLPTANLKGTAFEKGVFDVRVSATSPAGETQEGPSRMFALGKEYTIVPESDSYLIEVTDESATLKFYVENMLHKRVKKELKYTISRLPDYKTIAEGTFTAPNLQLPIADMPSAEYAIDVELLEDENIDADTRLTLWRRTDKSAPAGTGLWTPEKVIYAKPGEKKVNVTIGSGRADRWIPAVLSGDKKIISTKWLHIEKDNISLPVEAPTGYESLNLNLTYLSDLNYETATIKINSAESADRLQVKTESFRDRLTAGDQEKWTFRFSRNYTPTGIIPAMAVMTDKALNAIAPFEWAFNPSPDYRPTYYYINHSFNRLLSIYTNIRSSKYLRYNGIELPILQDYNRNWGIGATVIRNTVMLTSAAIADNGVMMEASEGIMRKSAQRAAGAAPMAYDMADDSDRFAVQEESVMAYGYAAGMSSESQVEMEADSSEAESEDSTELRSSECPVAFFMPFLTTDKDGMLNVEFTTPNFNTTWAFQLIGYDERLQTTKVALEAVASKPVMVTTSAPRFVRTGDRIEIAATAFNNSGKETPVKGRLELVDLLSGKLIASKDFAEENLADGANRLMTMEWCVGDGISSVGFRAYAESGSHKDGEQAIVPVLPSSTPVVESTPFWISPGGKEISVKLPKFKPTDQVTLQYCDNPAWYCLTSLPEIVNPDTKSITSKARALFGNATAFHLISSNPALRQGLEALLSDKDSPFASVRSNLEKDGQLKITSLNNTPWVNNAESETLRMSRLSTLLDAEGAESTISGILDELKEAQTSAGGWSWCPDMRPSSWITSEVVRYLAMCSRNGALAGFPAWENIARRGVAFVDGEMVDDYHKYHKKGESLAYLLDWVYVRSSLPQSVIPQGAKSREMNGLAARALVDISKEWKDYGIAEKAKTAMVLARNGKVKEASAILESIRQYASETPEKGIWFDNLSSGYGGLFTLRTTTLALQAFAELQPANKVIDGLRQWMVLGRQYQDWGKSADVAETVNAILTSGSDWTTADNSGKAGIYLGDKEIEIPSAAALTGAFTISLRASDASKKTLKVKREGSSPAWGGVVCQYVSPIEDVAASEVPDLSIEKRLVALVEQPDGSMKPVEGIELKKGMKVRVTLILNAGRDLDYVAVTDSRSACLEPTEQLSGIRGSDGVWYYKEVRDEATNLYFDTLPKGVHVVSYDCRVGADGDFSCGIATAQSQYSPSTVAHTSGFILKSR
ncbi:MAG: hypothetical protein K2K93_04265, partial [Muribaculaceae bacterium]|nr:hypothetical protein [Muribaculaceae bacterium]